MTSPTSLSRREVLRLSGLAVGLAGSAAVPLHAAAPPDKPADRDPETVLAQLLAGNRRFAAGKGTSPRRLPADFMPLAEGQAPLAVIVGCADSRVSPELLFDKGVGDLFVVRIAGNVISGGGAAVKGSIEYAVAELGVRLIMVLGHSQCGAVKAAIKHIDAKDVMPGSITDLVDTIKPAVVAARGKRGNLLDNVIRTNVERGVERLKGLKPILAGRVKKKEVMVVGATYDLRSGRVRLLS